MLELDEQIQSYRELYDWVRPHEALGQVPPMVRYLAEPPDETGEAASGSHLSEAEPVQVS